MTPAINLRPALTPAQAQDIAERWDDTLIQLTGQLCGMAAIATLQARDELRAAGLLHRETARRMHLALHEWKIYESRLTDGDTRGRQFIPASLPYETRREIKEWWSDIGAQAWQGNARRIEMLRMQYHNAFTAGGLPHPRELSWLALTAWLWNYAAATFAATCEVMRREWHADLTERFSGLSPYRVAKAWASVGSTLQSLDNATRELTPYHRKQIRQAQDNLKASLRHDFDTQAPAIAAADDHLPNLKILTPQPQ